MPRVIFVGLDIALAPCRIERCVTDLETAQNELTNVIGRNSENFSSDPNFFSTFALTDQAGEGQPRRGSMRR